MVCLLQGFTHDFHGLAVARLFLGFTESGISPTVWFYLSLFYPRKVVIYRVCLLFAAAALSGSVAGLLAYGIGFMRGEAGQAGWRWIFQLEGAATVLLGICAVFMVYRDPHRATFLTEPERELLLDKLRRGGGDAAQQQRFEWQHVRAAFSDPSVWTYSIMGAGTSLPLTSVSVYLPSIIKALGFEAARAQLMTVPLYAIAFVLTLLAAHYSFKLEKRWIFVAAGTCVSIVGYVLLIVVHSDVGQFIGSGFVLGGIYPAVAIILAWQVENISGQTKRAVGCGIVITVTQAVGTMVGTFVYRPKDAPRYYLGHGAALVYLCTTAVAICVQVWLLSRRNAQRALLRAERDTAGATTPPHSLPSQTAKDRASDSVEEKHTHVHDQINDDIGDHTIDWVYQL